MSFDYTAAQTAIVDWAEAVSGLTVLISGQDAAQPALPYLVLGLAAGPRSEHKPAPGFEADGSITYAAPQTIITEFQARGGNAGIGAGSPYAILGALLATTGEYQTQFEAAGLAIQERGSVNRIPTVEGTSWTQVASVEITWGYVETVNTDSAGYHERAEITGTLQPGNKPVLGGTIP